MSGSHDEITRLTAGAHERHEDGELEVHEFAVEVPSSLRWFQGHFDGNPVLPAMVQLHEALRFTATVWPDLTGLRRVTRAKFRRPIRPLDTLRLRLERTRGAGKASFAFVRGDEICSSGVFEFAHAEGASGA
jgi:3-hydroxymyristoyl/3-hydroxydecanoyl-(acyl carrier protein) dehydratase